MSGFLKISGLCFFVLLFALCLQTPHIVNAQLSTTDHLADPGFWPTKNDAERKQYAGAQACANCHAGIAASQNMSAMRQTAMHAANSDVLHSHPRMTFAVGGYHYEITSAQGPPTYTVTHNAETLTAKLLWAFGTDRVGQSYLFKKDDGKFYEARITYFSSLQTVDFTPDRALLSPKNIQEAMYRPVDDAEIIRCFGCHSTGSSYNGKFDDEDLTPGVTCEACHGPGASHVNTMTIAKIAGITETNDKTIFNPAMLAPADAVDFCGSCHGTWWDVKLSGVRGVSDVKSQPYRLEMSKCWGQGDARLTCTACHDPHQPLQTNSASYDVTCLRCHVNSGSAHKDASHPGAACPVSTRDCVSCHMPKVYAPEMHYKFTDHDIRIVRAGENYPD